RGDAATAKGLEHYRKAGEALLRAKKAVGHGGWGPYLESVGIPHQWASECMRLACADPSKLPPGGTLKGALEALTKLAVEEVAARLPHPPPEPTPKTTTVPSTSTPVLPETARVQATVTTPTPRATPPPGGGSPPQRPAAGDARPTPLFGPLPGPTAADLIVAT